MQSFQDFAAYLHLLSADCEAACHRHDPHAPAARGWTNRSVDDFLWALVRLLEGRLDGTDLLYDRPSGHPPPRSTAGPHAIVRLKTGVGGMRTVGDRLP